jgi:acyl-CoA thioesterase YciA
LGEALKRTADSSYVSLSLRLLCVLGVSAVSGSESIFTAEAQRSLETTQRKLRLRHHQTFHPFTIYELTIYYPDMNSDPAIRIAMLPRDTNSQGTIFGGVILSYIDMAGAIEAHRHTGMDRFVTVAMREVIFHAPVFIGDLVSFYSETVKVGTTSITVRVVVEAERYGGPSERVRVTEAEVIYVAVDKTGKKMKIAAK